MLQVELLEQASLRAALDGCDGVIHAASPMHDTPMSVADGARMRLGKCRVDLVRWRPSGRRNNASEGKVLETSSVSPTPNSRFFFCLDSKEDSVP